MDNSQEPITCVEWCAGYAGLHLGLKRAIPNLRPIAFSEIEAFAVANLVAKMETGLLESAPIWPDVKTFPSEAFHGIVDILVAGYPCQPFSIAGNRLGANDPRHLWPHIIRGIRTMRPRVCFFENVENHINLGLPEVLFELQTAGYQTTWGIFSASEVGAPHHRKRVYILAYSIDKGLEGRIPRRSDKEWENFYGHAGRSRTVDAWTSRPYESQPDYEPPRTVEPKMGGNAHGHTGRMDNATLYQSCDNRIDEIRLLGNGVVPAVAELAWNVLWDSLIF